MNNQRLITTPPRFWVGKMTGAFAGLLPSRRLPLLVLLALAAAFAALTAADSAQAQAQYTYWSATLTVDEREQYHGCDDEDSSQANCSDASVLTDNDFTFDGDTYTLYAVYWNSNLNLLTLAFKDMFSADVEPALGSMTLHVDGAQFAVADSIEGSQGAISWDFDPDPDWTDGQEVRLRLTSTVAPPPQNEQKLLLSATLTVDEENGFYGCYNGSAVLALSNCTKNHALSNPKFTYQGNNYKVSFLTWHKGSGAFDPGLRQPVKRSGQGTPRRGDAVPGQ